MKLIEVLNKIANGEKVPKEIKINDNILIWNNIQKDYLRGGKEEYYTDRAFITPYYDLNDEIEIIEEDKPIEKLKYREDNIEMQIEAYADKINELIDKINKLEEGKNR